MQTMTMHTMITRTDDHVSETTNITTMNIPPQIDANSSAMDGTTTIRLNPSADPRHLIDTDDVPTCDTAQSPHPAGGCKITTHHVNVKNTNSKITMVHDMVGNSNTTHNVVQSAMGRPTTSEEVQRSIVYKITSPRNNVRYGNGTIMPVHGTVGSSSTIWTVAMCGMDRVMTSDEGRALIGIRTMPRRVNVK